MIVKVNNEICIVEEGILLSKLISDRCISDKGVAVAVNGKIVRRLSWEVTRLSDGDDIVVLNAAYGG